MKWELKESKKKPVAAFADLKGESFALRRLDGFSFIGLWKKRKNMFLLRSLESREGDTRDAAATRNTRDRRDTGCLLRGLTVQLFKSGMPSDANSHVKLQLLHVKQVLLDLLQLTDRSHVIPIRPFHATLQSRTNIQNRCVVVGTVCQKRHQALAANIRMYRSESGYDHKGTRKSSFLEVLAEVRSVLSLPRMAKNGISCSVSRSFSRSAILVRFQQTNHAKSANDFSFMLVRWDAFLECMSCVVKLKALTALKAVGLQNCQIWQRGCGKRLATVNVDQVHVATCLVKLRCMVKPFPKLEPKHSAGRLPCSSCLTTHEDGTLIGQCALASPQHRDPYRYLSEMQTKKIAHFEHFLCKEKRKLVKLARRLTVEVFIPPRIFNAYLAYLFFCGPLKLLGDIILRIGLEWVMWAMSSRTGLLHPGLYR